MKRSSSKPIAAAKPLLALKEPWSIAFFERRNFEKDSELPALGFLESCGSKLRARFTSVLIAVAAAPPPSFSGGGLWEAMHDDMAGFYEVRIDSGKTHYRLFCILEKEGKKVGLNGPSIVILMGLTKPFRTVLSKSDYQKVKAMGEEYRSADPRTTR